ncbi:hypothetical protein VNO77_44047 [Canavalia gladiata]|uniref:Uncharacterized protein n=1 Tax=Canavalia gladiata TaxID=3824 RepID=A0AAN9PQ04_CANGL
MGPTGGTLGIKEILHGQKCNSLSWGLSGIYEIERDRIVIVINTCVLHGLHGFLTQAELSWEASGNLLRGQVLRRSLQRAQGINKFPLESYMYS